jgi:hypothetical protein
LEGLDPALRQEILATSDQNFLDRLPEQYNQEAMMLQEGRANYRNESDLLQPQRNEPSEPPLNFIEKTLKKERNQQQLNLELREKLYNPEDRLIESLIKLLYLEDSKFSKFPFAILTAISQHPRGEYMIFDTLSFLLKNKSIGGVSSSSNEGGDKKNMSMDSQDGGANQMAGAPEEEFPPRKIYESNRVLNDKESIYAHVSGHILFILYCLTQNRSNYFVEKAEDLVEMFKLQPTTLSPSKSSSLGSI